MTYMLEGSLVLMLVATVIVKTLCLCVFTSPLVSDATALPQGVVFR
jgi:hypothetical protein